MISVSIAAPAGSNDLAASIAETISGLTTAILRKDPRVTAVSVEFVEREHWFIGGRSVASLGTAAFFVDVRITDGTNTKDEKERFVAAAFAALDALLDGAHHESYVHVHDVRADAYGYGGSTQERRYINGRPSAASRIA